MAINRCDLMANITQSITARVLSIVRTKNLMDGIESVCSSAKHILYNYRGVSKYHFPMYLKEIVYRFNHHKGPAL